jgi:hypothetical protein
MTVKKNYRQMKVPILLLLSFFFIQIEFTCKAQDTKIIDLSSDKTANYLLANITEINYSYQEVFNRSFFLNVYTLDDSKATPLDYFEEYDGILSSILISIIPDGDYYVGSKLFKIEGLENPKIVSLKEKEFPEFLITVESGPVENRQTIQYNLRGFDQ